MLETGACRVLLIEWPPQQVKSVSSWSSQCFACSSAMLIYSNDKIYLGVITFGYWAQDCRVGWRVVRLLVAFSSSVIVWGVVVTVLSKVGNVWRVFGRVGSFQSTRNMWNKKKVGTVQSWDVQGVHGMSKCYQTLIINWMRLKRWYCTLPTDIGLVVSCALCHEL